MLKRFIWGGVLAVAVCVLPSCLSGSGFFGGQEESGGLRTVAVKQDQPQVVLRYSSYLLDTAQAGRTYYKAIQEFEALHPEIKIETDFIQNTYYTAGIKARLLGGEKLDVFDTWSPSLFAEFLCWGITSIWICPVLHFCRIFYPPRWSPLPLQAKFMGFLR